MQKLMLELRELAKKKVRRSFVGPWGHESEMSDMSLAEFLDEIEKMRVAKNKPKMTKHSEYGELFPVDEFDGFYPSDGYGVWATSTLQSNLSFWSVDRPYWATHVMWYNK